MKQFVFLLFLSSISFADCDVTNALQTLTPKAEWNLYGTQYSGLQWLDKTQTKPTLQQVQQSISDCLQTQQNLKQQIQNDIFNIQLSTNTAVQKLPALIDLLKQRGLLQ